MASLLLLCMELGLAAMMAGGSLGSAGVVWGAAEGVASSLLVFCIALIRSNSIFL